MAGQAAPWRAAAGYAQQATPAVRALYVGPARPVRAPSRYDLWWARTRAAVGSDLTVHGLAYLGVLMLFVGMFGLVAFAFGEVTPGLRPVAELACVAIPFGAGGLLRRHAAEIVGRALEVVGGLLLPLMVTASVVDGFPIPPDVHGGALVVLLTAVGAATAAGYAGWSRAHPASGLRLVVGPVAWYTAAMATLGVGRPVPIGQDVAIPTSAQVTALAAALVLTLVAARLRPAARLAGPALTAAVPGTLALGVLALLVGAAHDWPGVQIALVGFLVLAALELLRVRVPGKVLDLVSPAWWAAVALALVAGQKGGVATAVSAAGFLVLVEIAGRRSRPAVALALPAAGLLACLTGFAHSPWSATVAFAVLLGWAVARRAAPYAVPNVAGFLDAAAAIAPVALVLALASATNATTGLLGATTLTVLATVPATRVVARRGPCDAFWRRWWSAAVPVTAASALVLWLPDGASSAARWAIVGVLAALAVVCMLGPLARVAQVWAVTALAVVSWILASSAGEISDPVRGGALAALGLALVVVGHLVRPGGLAGAPAAVRAALALAGHATAVAALALAGTRWGLVGAMAAATAGLVVTAAFDDLSRSRLGEALGRAGSALRYAPWILAATSAPVTVSLALDTAGVVARRGIWAPAVLAGTGIVYAAAARAGARGRLGATMAIGGFVAALAALATSTDVWPAIVAQAALVGTVVVVPAARRTSTMLWTAWAVLAPLAGLLARQGSGWFAARDIATEFAVTLIAVGGVLLVGAAALDLRGRAWAPRWAPCHRSLVPPVVLGGFEVCLGLLLAPAADPRDLVGLLILAVAGIVLATGVLARSGSFVCPAVLLGWWGTALLAGSALGARPWVAVIVTVGLLIVAESLHRLTSDRVWWTRWDIPLLIAAAPVALTALGLAAEGTEFVATYVAVGLVCIAVAVRLHRAPVVRELVGWSGTFAILAGAAHAGGGWLVLALLALSAAHTALSAYATGVVRVLRLCVGAGGGVAAWCAALAWFAWPVQMSVDATVVGAGVGVVFVVTLARRAWLDVAAVVVWGVAATSAAAIATMLSLGSLDQAVLAPSDPVVAGVVLLAAGLALAAIPLRAPWLRDVSAAPALLSLLVFFTVWGVEPGAQVGVLSGACAGLAGIVLADARRAPRSPWARPGAEFGALAAATAFVVGLAALPDAMVVVPAIAAGAAWSASTGVVWRRVGLQMLSPVAACAAWMVFVAATVHGGPQWYTIAVGITLLGIVSLWRRDRRALGADPAGPQVVALEIIAMAFLVAAPFVEAITVSVAHALVAAALGAGVAGWGVLIRVRRRVVIGAVTGVAALVVLVVVPLVALLPPWGGVTAWLLIATTGLVAVLAATMLEKARTAARTTRVRFRGMTAGWE